MAAAPPLHPVSTCTAIRLATASLESNRSSDSTRSTHGLVHSFRPRLPVARFSRRLLIWPREARLTARRASLNVNRLECRVSLDTRPTEAAGLPGLAPAPVHFR